MDDRIKKAVAYHHQGYNCAQAVFGAFADLCALDEASAKKIAAGLGAGIGRFQSVCGAVSGAVLVIGSLYFKGEDIIAAKELTYQKTRDFLNDFAAKNGSTCCLDLLGVSLQTAEGKKAYKEKNYGQVKCEQYIIDACQLLLAKYVSGGR